MRDYKSESLIRIMNFKDQLIVRVTIRVCNWIRCRFEFLDDRTQTMPDNLRNDVCQEAMEDNKYFKEDA